MRNQKCSDRGSTSRILGLWLFIVVLTWSNSARADGLWYWTWLRVVDIQVAQSSGVAASPTSKEVGVKSTNVVAPAIVPNKAQSVDADKKVVAVPKDRSLKIIVM